MDLIEKTINSEIKYDSKNTKVEEITVSLPNKEIGIKTVIRRPQAVAILPIDENGNIIMIKQFRKAIDKTIYEIPAGKVDENEDLHDAVNRELMEEVGLYANELYFLSEIYPSPGYTDEVIYLYVGKDLIKKNANKDEDEFIEIEKISAPQFEKYISGSIKDAKTIITYFLAKTKGII